MNKITEYIVQINSLNYNKQCKYVKNKLLSIENCAITDMMFFKKLQIILKKLPIFLKEIDIEFNQNGYHLFNFFYELDDRSYFKEEESIKGYIKVNHIKLSDNMYQIDVKVKKSSIPIISYMLIKYKKI